MSDIGTRIRNARLCRNLSCRELADLTGFSRELIQKWEKGERRIHADQLAEICKALYVNADTLLGINDIALTPTRSDKQIDCAVWLIKQCAEQVKKILKGE